jgi:hypothetical protein
MFCAKLLVARKIAQRTGIIMVGHQSDWCINQIVAYCC